MEACNSRVRLRSLIPGINLFCAQLRDEELESITQFDAVTSAVCLEGILLGQIAVSESVLQLHVQPLPQDTSTKPSMAATCLNQPDHPRPRREHF